MNDSLGDRMKRYQEVFDQKLLIKTPILIHLDGKAFHTFCRGLIKPFDQMLMDTMDYTANQLVAGIQGCKLAYVQSDEISLLLTDWENYETDQWFDGRVQKITSISAAIATFEFNKMWQFNAKSFGDEQNLYPIVDEAQAEAEKVRRKMKQGLFDSRAFNLPHHEVGNWFIWRQNDWRRNSVQMLARSHFSHKSLQNMKTSEMIEILKNVGASWESLSEREQNGATIYRGNGNKIVKDCSIKFKENREFIKERLEPEP
jgi:tRNA(His) 5'-end guanylyltransferase